MGDLLLLIVLISLVLFSLIIPIFYLRYIHRMKKEKCACSQGFNRNFIQFYSIYNYVSIVALVILSLVISRHKVNNMLESPTRLVMSTGFSFLTAYYLYHYQKKVYQDSCVCAVESWEPRVMRVHSYVIGILFLIGVLNIVALLTGETRIPNQIRKSIQNNIRNNLK